MISGENIRTAVDLITHADPRTTAHELRGQAWGVRVYLGLRCELSELPKRRPARLDLEMRPRSASAFRGLGPERHRAGPADLKQLLLRERLCRHGVRTLYLAETSSGRPIYCQWLIRPGDQHLLERFAPGRYAPLRDDEVLLEGAYTFTEFRGKRTMSDGMWQLLAIARNEGHRAALTYVADDNVPSLRGCAAVGFVPYHLHVNIRRLTKRRTETRPLDDAARRHWQAATE